MLGICCFALYKTALIDASLGFTKVGWHLLLVKKMNTLKFHSTLLYLPIVSGDYDTVIIVLKLKSREAVIYGLCQEFLGLDHTEIFRAHCSGVL